MKRSSVIAAMQRFGWLASICLAGCLAAGCFESSKDHDLPMPPRASFEPVSEMLYLRCGVLTCHGAPERNLRLYGALGLRLSPNAHPGDGTATTAAEHDANYLSVLALEPELLSEVFVAGGAEPERLTLIRKARDQEDHKGTGLVSAGDAADRCLLSWLKGKTDEAACIDGTW